MPLIQNERNGLLIIILRSVDSFYTGSAAEPSVMILLLEGKKKQPSVEMFK
jgi:hypothetical protein